MAVDPLRRRARISYPGGQMITCLGLLNYLGIKETQPGETDPIDNNRRRTRRSKALPGQSCELLLKNGETYKVTIVGTFKKWEDAFCIKKPSDEIIQLVTQRGTIYARSV